MHKIGTELIATAGTLTHVYGPAEEEMILIRPDGYVAARLPLDEAATSTD